MILFPELPPLRFRPMLSFACEAEREYFMQRLGARLLESSELFASLGGIEIRTSPFVPRGRAVLNKPDGIVIIDIEQGFDANGAPA